MCGRFSLSAKPEDLTEALPGFVLDYDHVPRYNIAPSQPIATVLNVGNNLIVQTQWGLIPSWAKDPAIGNRMINARGETLAEKPAFKAPFKRRRCLILADGFYEWQKRPGERTKQPFLIRLKSGKPFALAGLWDEWNDREGGVLTTSTIITTEPNALVKQIHNRMPVILRPESYETWLRRGEQPAADMQPCLVPFPEEDMEAFAVSSHVNRPAADDPECIRPLSA